MSRPENGPEFPIATLLHWLRAAELRYGGDGHAVTAKRSGATLAIFQDGVYRSGIDLDDERPYLSGFAADA